jgi:hypothetical protein
MKNECEGLGVTHVLENASGGISMRSASKITSWLAAAGALVACLSLTSEVHAWGTCGRGPWVTASERVAWTGDSVCRCSNGQRGSIKLMGSLVRGVINAWNGPSNGGAGAEIEVFDNQTNQTMAIGLTFSTFFSGAPSSLAMPNGQWFEGWYDRDPVDDRSGRYSWTQRYRSVCITNYPSLPEEPDVEPWIWW